MTARGRPSRSSSNSPSRRSAAKRLRHFFIVFRGTPSPSAINPFGAAAASAQASTTRDRNAIAYVFDGTP